MSILLKQFIKINQSSLLRQVQTCKYQCLKKKSFCSTVPLEKEPSVQAVYCKLDSHQQTIDHEGMMYVLPKEHSDRLFTLNDGFNKEHEDYFAFHGEVAFLIRRPALEIMNLLEKTDFNKPVNRYVLYGPYGNGKTFTLNHVMHYGMMKEFVLVHIGPVITRWLHSPQDNAQSESRPGRIDLPTESAMWLQLFRSRNASVLSKLNLKTSQKYTWSLREVTEQGAPLTDVIDHGTSRMKHASDCVAVLLKELKKLSNDGACRVLFTCDIANTFYGRTLLRHADTRPANVDDLTIARAFKKLFVNDWRNGAVVVVVDTKPYLHTRTGVVRWKGRLYNPKHLLTEEGFEVFDPFIPIKVPKYNEKEIENLLDYYTEKRYLLQNPSHTASGRTEIKFLSAYYPRDLFKLCSGL